jgi:hypothetical protein
MSSSLSTPDGMEIGTVVPAGHGEGTYAVDVRQDESVDCGFVTTYGPG